MSEVPDFPQALEGKKHLNFRSTPFYQAAQRMAAICWVLDGTVRVEALVHGAILMADTADIDAVLDRWQAGQYPDAKNFMAPSRPSFSPPPKVDDVRLLVSLVEELCQYASRVKVHIWRGTFVAEPGTFDQEALARHFLPGEVVDRETVENGGWNGRVTALIPWGNATVETVAAQLLAARTGKGAGSQARIAHHFFLANPDSTAKSIEADLERRRVAQTKAYHESDAGRLVAAESEARRVAYEEAFLQRMEALPTLDFSYDVAVFAWLDDVCTVLEVKNAPALQAEVVREFTAQGFEVLTDFQNIDPDTSDRNKHFRRCVGEILGRLQHPKGVSGRMVHSLHTYWLNKHVNPA